MTNKEEPMQKNNLNETYLKETHIQNLKSLLDAKPNLRTAAEVLAEYKKLYKSAPSQPTMSRYLKEPCFEKKNGVYRNKLTVDENATNNLFKTLASECDATLYDKFDMLFIQTNSCYASALGKFISSHTSIKDDILDILPTLSGILIICKSGKKTSVQGVINAYLS